MPKPYPEKFRRGTTRDESAELREARKRIRQLEQEAKTITDLPAGPRPGR